MVPRGELLFGDALKGEGPLASLEPVLDSPSCCTLRQSELERLCFAGLQPLVAAVSVGAGRGVERSVTADAHVCNSAFAVSYPRGGGDGGKM